MPRPIFYPPIEPFAQSMLRVDGVHTLYFEQSGNPNGKPVVVLHGGPGGGSHPGFRRFFNPERYHIVVFDQRGCGKSTPHAELKDNTTWHLVSDIEKLREHLGVETWQVFGGSWGSTLGLAYAESHPDRVTELILRGIFLLRTEELQWFYQQGASFLFPEAFAEFQKPVPIDERDDMLRAYHRLLHGPDKALRAQAAKAWTLWEMGRSTLRRDPHLEQRADHLDFSVAMACIENHFFVHKGFFQTEDQLLRDGARLGGIPGVIVHGRYDVICPVKNAVDLHRAWPDSDLHIIEDAGHAQTEEGIARALTEATDRFGRA